MAVLGVVLALTTGALVLTSAVAGSQRARLAADLAALHGATLLRDGSSVTTACGGAGRVARANVAVLQACSAQGTVITVVVAVDVTLWPAPALARSRAGPSP